MLAAFLSSLLGVGLVAPVPGPTMPSAPPTPASSPAPVSSGMPSSTAWPGAFGGPSPSGTLPPSPDHQPSGAAPAPVTSGSPAAVEALPDAPLTAGLDITVSPAVNLGAGFTGGLLTGSLGTVEVRDFRGNLTTTWVAGVTSTSFVTGAGGVNRTVPNSMVSYWSGPLVKATGGGTLVPGQATAAQAVPLNVSRVAFRKTGGNGNNTVSWRPTLRINLPTNLVAGTYIGTITHSVA
jgi:hypothetical protein